MGDTDFFLRRYGIPPPTKEDLAKPYTGVLLLGVTIWMSA